MVAAVGHGHMPLMHPFFQKGSVTPARAPLSSTNADQRRLRRMPPRRLLASLKMPRVQLKKHRVQVPTANSLIMAMGTPQSVFLLAT